MSLLLKLLLLRGELPLAPGMGRKHTLAFRFSNLMRVDASGTRNPTAGDSPAWIKRAKRVASPSSPLYLTVADVIVMLMARVEPDPARSIACRICGRAPVHA